MRYEDALVARGILSGPFRPWLRLKFRSCAEATFNDGRGAFSCGIDAERPDSGADVAGVNVNR